MSSGMLVNQKKLPIVSLVEDETWPVEKELFEGNGSAKKLCHGKLSQQRKSESFITSEANVVMTSTDRAKCDFVEARERLKTKILNINKYQLENHTDKHLSKGGDGLLFASLRTMKEMFKDLSGYVLDDEVKMFESDLEHLEKSLNCLTSRIPKTSESFEERLLNQSPCSLRMFEEMRCNSVFKKLQKRLYGRSGYGRRKPIVDYKDFSDSEPSESSDSVSTNSDGERQLSGKRRRIREVAQDDFESDRADEYSLSESDLEKIPKRNILALKNICMVCGTNDVWTEHPLFVGGLCQDHVLLAQEKILQYDVDGYASSCCVCFVGSTSVLCRNLSCGRCYCKDCLNKYVSLGAHQSAAFSNTWNCCFCSRYRMGLLRRRPDWQYGIDKLFESSEQRFPPLQAPPAIPINERKPIRVLSLFDGISAGILALQQLGIEIEKFVASEVDEDALRLVKNKHPQVFHVGDITKLSDDDISRMGPFDLLIGGSPCNDLSSVNPLRKGLLDAEGTGTLFFDYYRILSAVRQPHKNGIQMKTPFFWLFENVVSMRKIEKLRISHYLQ